MNLQTLFNQFVPADKSGSISDARDLAGRSNLTGDTS